MILPPYFLPRPIVAEDAATIAAFERLYDEVVEDDRCTQIDYALTAPKWQFLCWVCDHKDVLLHGSGNASIAEFEPRQSNDVAEFGNRRAVYAASDGLWPMYFAIVDRERYVTSLTNSCFRIVESDGSVSEAYYYFSVNADALPHNPWRHGTLYLLPRAGFEQQPLLHYRGRDIEPAHWASLAPVRPLAKLSIAPEDFPFLAQIQPHDPNVIRERAAANPDGFPWIDE